jgi:hypothetical protein
MTWFGTLTRTETPHRVGPPAGEVIDDPELRDALLPLALLDGGLWGVSGYIPVIYTQYNYSELRFRRDAVGRLRIKDKSRRHLLGWISDEGAPVDGKPKFRGRYVHLRECGAPTAIPVPDRDTVAVRITAEPEWLQFDETPELNGRPMRFLYQAFADGFSHYIPGFEIYAFSDRSVREIAYVFQIS